MSNNCVIIRNKNINENEKNYILTLLLDEAKKENFD